MQLEVLAISTPTQARLTEIKHSMSLDIFFKHITTVLNLMDLMMMNSLLLSLDIQIQTGLEM
jgi:hypothetical protein